MFTQWRVARLVAVKLASSPVHACRNASREARIRTGHAAGSSFHQERRTERNDITEEDLDMDEVESQVETLVREGKKRKKAVKFHTIRRQMSSHGSPERRLSWEAIQQIRFLKQESPQEWTLERLAEGFSVSSDVISRVLRSKFTPPVERRLKQDAKVLAPVRSLSLGEGKNASLQKGQLKLPVPASTDPAMISSGSTSPITALTSGALSPVECEAGLVPLGDNGTSVLRTTLVSPVASKTLSVLSDKNQELMNDLVMEEEEEWDGIVLTEEDLEKIINTPHEEPSPVEQRGSNFYDCEGNFLYRI